jgi:hypothetical protein
MKLSSTVHADRRLVAPAAASPWSAFEHYRSPGTWANLMTIVLVMRITAEVALHLITQ